MSSLASALWETLNSDDTYLPFYLTLSIFSASYIFCWLYNNEKKDRWNRWYMIHNCHNAGAIFLGTLSILSINLVETTSSSSILSSSGWSVNERVPILWSLGYFVVDVLDAAVRRDGAYLFHGTACLGLGLANYHTPLLFQLRMNSKAAFCELSSPLMHWAKTTRQPLIFLAFAVVFTLCRMLWLPYMYRECLEAGMLWTHPALLLMAAFYGLNCLWYYKIWVILVRGVLGKKEIDEQKKES